MADPKAALVLKFGDKEVRYEANREAVEAQLEHVIGRFLEGASTDAQISLTDLSPVDSGDSAPSPVAAPIAASKLSEEQLLKQLFVISRSGHLRLRQLPPRTADALLLVLYGMRKLQNRTWVHAPGMTGAARASGARFERADRLLAAYQDLVEGFGQRRGKRYRLTAAGREYCASLVRSLVDPAAITDVEADTSTRTPTGDVDSEAAATEPRIPEKVTKRWKGCALLTVTEAAEQLGIDEAEVGRMRRRWQLLGLPGGNRKQRLFFYPVFQINTERREIDPNARVVTQLIGRVCDSWAIAEWYQEIEPELGRRRFELIGTPDAEVVVRAARARLGYRD